LGEGCLLLRGAREGMGKGKEGDGKGEGKGKGGKGEGWEARGEEGKGGREGRGEENFTLPPYALASAPQSQKAGAAHVTNRRPGKPGCQGI